MAKPLHSQIVERARSLITDEEHWCRGYLAQDASGLSILPTSTRAVKHCGLGAVLAAATSSHMTSMLHMSLPTKPCVHITAQPHLSTSTT